VYEILTWDGSFHTLFRGTFPLKVKEANTRFREGFHGLIETFSFSLRIQKRQPGFIETAKSCVRRFSIRIFA
jgi:hypothetical protein